MRSRSIIVAGISAILAVAIVLLPAVAGAAPPETVSAIVVLTPGSDVASVAPGLAAAHDGRVEALFTSVLGGFQFRGPAAALAGLRQSPQVRAVVPDQTFHLSEDTAGWGLFRIDAEVSMFDPAGPYRGLGTRVAIIDSGVDLDHPDLAPNLDVAAGKNCVSPSSPPDDDLGHGTHVAGIAAASLNDSGAVGVAPEARIVPLKAFDANGNGTTSQIICALDRLATVLSAAPAPTVINMSFADAGADSVCDDGDASDVLHEALCDVVDAGAAVGSPVVPVAAAGNAATDVASTIPAAFHDVIAVSAFTDLDGVEGGDGGCTFPATTFTYECDEMLASFSNHGSTIDLAAPGVEVWSTVPGGWDVKTGTSMAAPHVAGVVALVLGEDADLDASGVRTLLAQTGECPDGAPAGADASCGGQGQWQQSSGNLFDPDPVPDPDGLAEPLVNAGRAAAAADAGGDPPPVDTPPSVSIATPAAGSTVSGAVSVAASASDDHGIASIEFFVDGSSIGSDTTSGDGWSVSWDTTGATDASHVLRATATDTMGQTTTSADVSVTVDNAGPTTPMLHLAGLSGTTSNGKKWTATVTAVVHDAFGAPVDGATVTFEVTAGVASTQANGSGGKPGGGGGGPGGGGGGTPGSLTCVTDANGTCSVSTKPSGSSVTFAVTSVQKSGWDYDASAGGPHSITLSR